MMRLPIERRYKPLKSWLKEFFGRRNNRRIIQNYFISVAHPHKLSKRYTSPLYIYFYLPENRQEVELFLNNSRNKKAKLVEYIYNSSLSSDMVVNISLSCPVILFSEPVIKKLDKGVVSSAFVAKPKDDCYPGKHIVIVSIRDQVSGFEYVSIDFEIEIVDFAFDHISRPLLANITSIVLGIGSLISFVLTIIGKLDTALGVTAGTTAGIIVAGIQAFGWNLYYRQKYKNLLS